MTDRDPVALAREVLDLAHEDETVTVCSVPDNKVAALARAALRVDALADLLDHEADSRRAAGQDPFEVMTIRQEAARIRAALNGENRG